MVCAHHKGHRHLGVVLKQLLVLALVVEFVGLMLTQAVYALVVVERLEYLCHRVRLRITGLVGGKSAAAGLFLENLVALAVIEYHRAVLAVEHGADLRCMHTHDIAGPGDAESGCGRQHRRKHHQRCVGRESARCRRYSDYLVGNHLQSDVTGRCGGGDNVR